jgi:hypothetical protein
MSGIAWSFERNPLGGNEAVYLMTPLHCNPANTRVILWHHGVGGETFIIAPDQTARVNTRAILRALVDAGYAVCSADFGGAATFANDTNMTRIDNCLSFLSAKGFSVTRVGLLGESMGHMSLFNWAQLHQSSTAALMGFISLCDPSDTYDNQPGLAAQMDAAYPSGGWAGNKATHDPLLMDITGFPASRWRTYFATDDPTFGTMQANNEALAARLGVPSNAIAMGTGGHTDTPIGNVNSADVVAFFEAGLWV